MPLREYQCRKCGIVKEYLEPLESPKARLCEQEDCGGLSKRIYSTSSLPKGNRTSSLERYSPRVICLEITVIRRQKFAQA